MMDVPEKMPPLPPRKPYVPPRFSEGKRDLIFGALLLVSTLLACNFTLFGGFNLGFAIGLTLCVLCSVVYLWRPGKGKGYALSLLALCLVIGAGFARSDDGLVKFVLSGFLFVGINLGLVILAGKNRRSSGSVYSLEDPFYAFFGLGLGKLEPAFRGLGDTVRSGGKVGKNTASVGLGLLITVPLLAVLIPLLVSADAAFDGLIKLLPEFQLGELLATLFFGAMLWAVLFARGLGMRLEEKNESVLKSAGGGLAVLTLNTVLIAVCFVYVVYLVSQLAYFVGGFAGILPEEYTLAQYARRGFFEMAWLCVLNLGIMIFSMAFCKKKDPAPLLTRLLCLFIGIVTVFFVATASAKMFLYIGSYGLTRMRVLTQIVMLFLVLTTVIVCIWLFVPKLKYMQAVMLSALTIGAAVIWVDVDTQVAKYNVNAYLSGKLETVDVGHLDSLGDGAIPYLVQLSRSAPDRLVAEDAENYLSERYVEDPEDFRSWNYVNRTAACYLPTRSEYREAEKQKDEQEQTLPQIDDVAFLYYYDTELEAFCVGDGYVCLRGWENGSDKAVYGLVLPDGSAYEPVGSEEALLELCRQAGLREESFGNWIPLMESEHCSGSRFVGIRGRSISEDATLWYILDVQANATYGPYRSEDAYWQACYDLKATPIGDWQRTEDIS